MAACNDAHFPLGASIVGLGVMKIKPEQSVGRNINAVVTEIWGALILHSCAGLKPVSMRDLARNM